MKKAVLLFLAMLLSSALWGQQKYALVIGNGAYTNVGKLRNPVNDANDVAAALQGLGFNVDKLLDSNLNDMENAVSRFKNRLSVSKDAYGFFFYAGHGVQSGGINYLLPVNANIPSENYLRERAISVQTMMAELNDAGNDLNIIVLDACRDNPFGWARSGSRGLAVVSAPAGSIVMYATSANSVASDGTGRNGLFTAQLLKNLKTPGVEVQRIFNKTGEDVLTASGGNQHPEISVRYFGEAYLGAKPAVNVSAAPPPPMSGSASVGNVTVTSAIAGVVMIDGKETGTRINKAGGSVTIANVESGSTAVAIKGDDGKIVNAPNTVMVRQGQTVSVAIERPAQPSQPKPAPPAPATIQPAAQPERPAPANMVRIPGGTFTMGSPSNETGRSSDETQHQVTVSTFNMGKYEVTQKEWTAVMGNNPSFYKGDNLPVEKVSWYDAIEYCNKLSQKEGLTPAYTINGTNVSWNRRANGYRLPTEAEWEYACRAGTTTPYSSGSSVGNAGWYSDNSGSSTHAVGGKASNGYGLYDMHGNVWEWCWDWYGSYSSGAQTDPAGASSGSNRVLRGGSWYDSAKYVRSANRSRDTPSYRYYFLGFRLVRP